MNVIPELCLTLREGRKLPSAWRMRIFEQGYSLEFVRTFSHQRAMYARNSDGMRENHIIDDGLQDACPIRFRPL